MKYVKNV